MRVLVFGNPLLKEDSLPLRLLPELRKRFRDIEFVVADPNDFDHAAELIIDTAKGLKGVVVIDDIGKLETGKVLSMHEMDLGQMLKLAAAAGLSKGVKIIAVPADASPKSALCGIAKALTAIAPSESARRTTCKGHRRG